MLRQQFGGGLLDALLKVCHVSTHWEDLTPQKSPPNLLLFLLNLWAKHKKRKKMQPNTIVESILFEVATDFNSVSATCGVTSSSWFAWN